MGGVNILIKGKTPEEVEHQLQERVEEGKQFGLYVDVKTNVVEIPYSFGDPDPKGIKYCAYLRLHS